MEFEKVQMRVTQSVSGTKCLHRAHSLGCQGSQPSGWLDGPLQSFRLCTLQCFMNVEGKMVVATNLTDYFFQSFLLFERLFHLQTYSIIML